MGYVLMKQSVGTGKPNIRRVMNDANKLILKRCDTKIHIYLKPT